MKYYAGVGSRETPDEILKNMTEIAKILNDKRFVLRSGGAGGADSAFEKGAGVDKQIFLPFDGFNGRKVDGKKFFLPTRDAFKIAEKYHPAWDRCNDFARKCHARNVHQVLGLDLMEPVHFLVCWTKDGRDSGGTGQAIRIARAFSIPVINLKNKKFDAV